MGSPCARSRATPRALQRERSAGEASSSSEVTWTTRPACARRWRDVENDETAQGKRVADCAKDVGVEHPVYTSAARADDHPDLEHFETKSLVEKHIRGLDLSWTIPRPVYFLDNIVEGKDAKVHFRLLRHFVGADGRLQMIACDEIEALRREHPALLDARAFFENAAEPR